MLLHDACRPAGRNRPMPRTSPPTEQENTAGLTATECYELLADDQRRAAIEVLADRQSPVELSDLAAAVAAREAPPEGVDTELVDRVEVRLHHAHLPKLADFGVLEYEPETHVVDSFTHLDDEPLV